MSYLDFLNETYPIRNTAEEKSAFRQWALDEADKCGYTARAEQNEKHDNVVIGEPETAQVVFTAHYDTPKRSLTPNLMLPTNRALYWLYNICIALIPVVLALTAARYIRELSGYGMKETAGRLIWYFSYVILFIGLFKFMIFGPKNRHNYNDNTSGTAAILELAKRLKGDRRAAFILFDDEEKGKKGSKAYAKAHGDIKAGKLVVNLDCVANGEHFLACVPEAAKALTAWPALEQARWDADGFDLQFLDAKKASMNSDQKSFSCGVGICACRKYRSIGYCTPRIHTKYDTVASNANIDYLTENLARFVEGIG